MSYNVYIYFVGKSSKKSKSYLTFDTWMLGLEPTFDYWRLVFMLKYADIYKLQLYRELHVLMLTSFDLQRYAWNNLPF